MKTVLLVDDEQRMLDLLSLYLTPHGYKCIKESSGKDALSFLEKDKVDIVLLDIMMPDMDGWETCEKIREFSKVPIIMLTARNTTQDVVRGLKNGADDYVSKPFNEDELLARMDAVMRRTNNKETTSLEFKGITLDEDAFVAKYENQQIPITPKEFSLLSLLLKNPDKVFSRDHLMSSIWSFSSDTDDRTIDSHIRNIRDKFRKFGFPIDQYLKTVWGVGYKWNTEE